MKKLRAKLLAAALGVTFAAAGYAAYPYSDDLAWGMHDDGLLWLKAWNRAFVGDPGAGGSGIYPAPDGPANIYYGVVWVGTLVRGNTHLSGDLFIGAKNAIPEWRELPPTDREILMSNRSNWAMRPRYIKQFGTLDSYCRVDDADAGEKGPIPVSCDVHGVSWSREELDDFVAFRYHVKNEGSENLDEVYVAIAYDFDIGGEFSRRDDLVGLDRERLMPYMYDGDRRHPYLGLVCVNGPVRGARSWSSDTRTPSESIYKAAFECERKTPNDWCVLLSSGPYRIRSGQKQITTFAVVAGGDLEELQNNADAAAEAFARTPQPEPARPSAFRLFQNRPNPVEVSTKITFACATRAKVELAVYDVAGRRVATLADRVYDAGVYELEWAPVGVPPGVYLYEMRAAGERSVKAMVVAR